MFHVDQVSKNLWDQCQITVNNMNLSKSSQIHLDVKDAYKIINEAIGHDQEAVEFVKLYAEYIHAVDDIIDEGKNPKLILDTFNLATALFSSPFWHKHKDQLLIVDFLINNQYADVVSWEKSNDKWKRREAKALSHVGYNMLFAVIIVVAGRNKLREVSEKFRAWAHYKHLSDSEFNQELD
jgi:hypothetical protein